LDFTKKKEMTEKRGNGNKNLKTTTPKVKVEVGESSRLKGPANTPTPKAVADPPRGGRTNSVTQ